MLNNPYSPSIRFYSLTVKSLPSRTCSYGSTLADPSLVDGSPRRTNADPELGTRVRVGFRVWTTKAMSTNPSGGYQTPGTTVGGIVLNGDSDACPGCGRPLASHALDGGRRATLSPCGLDVSGVPTSDVVAALGRTTSRDLLTQ